ncbi:thiamine-phosphate pyrophosphorylase [Ruminiclostridium sufflavum DSM 19573]|uniref:Thiamine-phosphate pyrophosphorylase n=1 Tax=Ruminiclostridium sufflavum DSM 19573 TaxID=1121337 RepID=A0A318XNY4_9FIRM|nr:thiamine phosphate synthase [Ruminiclostridium sufflavum]PYG88735.1 thiamine-phosphate pyrophosphorylase [Ruminiclostridium sufflavum DSM 19573]
MIICVTNRLLCKGNFLERIEQIAKALPYSIILREKDLPLEEYEQLALECEGICRKYNVPLVINSYIAAARKLKASYIHLPAEIFLKHRKELSGFRQAGASVHSAEEAKFSEIMGADYLIAGHIFHTGCKRGVPPRGLDFLRQVCSAVSIPVFAIGGISESNANEVLKAGADGICMMSQLMGCDNVEAVFEGYREIFAENKKLKD